MRIFKRPLPPNLSGKFSLFRIFSWALFLFCNVHTLEMASREGLKAKASVTHCRGVNAITPEVEAPAGVSITSGVCGINAGIGAFLNHLWENDKATGVALLVALYDVVVGAGIMARLIYQVGAHIWRCACMRCSAFKRLWARRKRNKKLK
jgi:hypothetical protein